MVLCVFIILPFCVSLLAAPNGMQSALNNVMNAVVMKMKGGEGLGRCCFVEPDELHNTLVVFVCIFGVLQTITMHRIECFYVLK